MMSGRETCFSCGKRGHFARDCRARPQQRVPAGECYNCRKTGHLARECPERPHGDSLTCFTCHQPGHFARDCMTRFDYGGDDDVGDYDQQDRRNRAWQDRRDYDGEVSVCYYCGRPGHFQRECRQAMREYNQCFNCGETDHFARECPQAYDDDGGYGDEYYSDRLLSCFGCGEQGHFARDCPEKLRNGGGGARANATCYNCSEIGHYARECPQSDGAGLRKSTCYTCGEPGHFSRECPQQTEKEKPVDTNGSRAQSETEVDDRD